MAGDQGRGRRHAGKRIRWETEWGGKLEGLRKLKAQGVDVAEATLNGPPWHEDLEWVRGAFWSLHSGRPAGGMAPSPIPFADIDRYAERFGCEGDFPRFHDLIRAADRALLDTFHRMREGT